MRKNTSDRTDLFAWLGECLLLGDKNVEYLVDKLEVSTRSEAKTLLSVLTEVCRAPVRLGARNLAGTWRRMGIHRRADHIHRAGESN